jgi:hypothetical protein
MLCANNHNKLPIFVVLFFAEEKNKKKTIKNATDINADSTKLETLYLSTEKYNSNVSGEKKLKILYTKLSIATIAITIHRFVENNNGTIPI